MRKLSFFTLFVFFFLPITVSYGSEAPTKKIYGLTIKFKDTKEPIISVANGDMVDVVDLFSKDSRSDDLSSKKYKEMILYGGIEQWLKKEENKKKFEGKIIYLYEREGSNIIKEDNTTYDLYISASPNITTVQGITAIKYPSLYCRHIDDVITLWQHNWELKNKTSNNRNGLGVVFGCCLLFFLIGLLVEGKTNVTSVWLFTSTEKHTSEDGDNDDWVDFEEDDFEEEF